MKTPKVYSAMADPLRVWRWHGVRVELGYLGTEYLCYTLHDNGKLIFMGHDFKPSPMHDIDDIKSIYELLGFLTCRPGEVDAEYFKTWTPEQMAWALLPKVDGMRLYLDDATLRRERGNK